MVKLIQLTDEETARYALAIYEKEAILLLLETLLKKQSDYYEVEPIQMKTVLSDLTQVVQKIHTFTSEVLNKIFSKEETLWVLSNASIETFPTEKHMILKLND